MILDGKNYNMLLTIPQWCFVDKLKSIYSRDTNDIMYIMLNKISISGEYNIEEQEKLNIMGTLYKAGIYKDATLIKQTN
jgi:hypothetical protein